MTAVIDDQTVEQVFAALHEEAGSDTSSWPILVGVGPDDPDGSRLAVEWAADEANARGVALHVISVYDWKVLPTWANRSADVITTELRGSSTRALDAARAAVTTAHPDLAVSTSIVRGATSDVLCRLGEHAGALVVGDRHQAAFDRTILGSVGTTLAAHGPCPVVIMCGGSAKAAEPRDVVVGVDSDGAAPEVLDFAFAYADRNHLAVQAVSVIPPGVFDENEYMQPPPFAMQWLEQTVMPYREKYPEVEVRKVVLIDHVVGALAAQSVSESLLVVGRRADRKHPVLHPVSVSHRVIHHASCPVAVVPPRPN